MKVYAAIVEDRHVDTEVALFTDKFLAIDHARNAAKDLDHSGDQFDEIEMPGWVYYATFSCEGDFVRVEELELDKTN